MNYPKGILHRSNGTMKREISNLTDSSSGEDEMIAQLKETFHIVRKGVKRFQFWQVENLTRVQSHKLHGSNC